MEEDGKFPNKKGVVAVDVKNDTTAIVSLNADIFNKNNTNGNNAGLKEACVLDIVAYAVEEGDVVATFTSNVSNFKKASEVIATAVKGDVKVETEGVVTFVEDADNKKNIKDITITGLTNGAISEGEEITLKLKGDYEFNVKGDALYDKDDKGVAKTDIITCLNDAVNNIKITKLDEDEINFKLEDIDETQRPIITIGGFALRTTKKCEAGDVAKITVSSKDFDSVTLEVAKMVEEAVTYTVEDDELPTIWAGKAYVKQTHLRLLSKKTQVTSSTHQEKLHSHSLKESK